MDAVTGLVTSQTHRVIEIATGLNYLDPSGMWTESQDLIEPLPGGGAAGLHAPYRAYFSRAGLNDDAALTIVSKSNQVYQARVLGIYYFDAQTGRSNLLATPSAAAVAEILPPNQIVYRGAFDSDILKADLRYTYTKAALESDVIITRQPKLSPADCGLNPDTTRIQVRHQWLGAPQPRIQQGIIGQSTGPGLVDQPLDFGDLWFPAGHAFAWDGDIGRGTNAATISLPVAADAAQAPVGKEWQTAGGIGTLIESVSWSSIAPKLAQLPAFAKVASGSNETMLAAAGRPEAAPKVHVAARRTIEVAARPYEKPGVVLDYIVVSGNGSYDFAGFNGTNTYLLSGNGYFSGTLTFEAGCVVKYAQGYWLLTYGGVVCNGSQASPSVLTCYGDFLYGEHIAGGFLGASAKPALWLYYIAAPQTIQWMIVRNAQQAFEADANGCGAVTHTVANCSVFQGQIGIGVYNCNVSVQNSTYCYLTTPTTTGSSAQGCASITGSFTAANAPYLTTSPSSQCQFVLPTYNSVTFTAAAVPSSCTYIWTDSGYNIVGRNQSLTLTPAQLGTSYGGQKLWVFALDSYGRSTYGGGWVGIVNSSAMSVAQHWTTYTNNKTCNLWSCRPNTDPPTGLAWDTSCLLYGKTGFTAISQCNDWDLPYRGTCPVTALTPRHGYMRGHGTYGSDNPFAGLNTNFNGQHVYFCTGDGNNTLVTATVAMGWTRCETNNCDHTILVFTADLPATIQPMEVSANSQTYWPATCSVIFETTQSGHMSANNPPFSYGVGADHDAFPPFNIYETWVGGDCGSPIILPATDDVLVFIMGIGGTSGPNSYMQTDMNTLSQYVGCTQYQMRQHSVQ